MLDPYDSAMGEASLRRFISAMRREEEKEGARLAAISAIPAGGKGHRWRAEIYLSGSIQYKRVAITATDDGYWCRHNGKKVWRTWRSNFSSYTKEQALEALRYRMVAWLERSVDAAMEAQRRLGIVHSALGHRV